MFLKKIITFISSITFAATAYCGMMGSYGNNDVVVDEPNGLGWSKVITLSAGPAWNAPGRWQGNMFIPHRKTKAVGTGELFFSLQNYVAYRIIGRLGLTVAGASDAKVYGTAHLVTFRRSARYVYSVNHARVAVKGLLAADKNVFFVQPYISGSFGMGFNHSFSFATSPTIQFVDTTGRVVAYDYASNTTQTYSYTLGAGILKRINDNWEVGIGYEFADWGNSELAKSLPLPFNFPPPHLTHLYTHEIQFSLSYLC